MASADDILKEALKLNRADRVELICFLLDGLDPSTRQAVEEEAGISSDDLKAHRADFRPEEES